VEPLQVIAAPRRLRILELVWDREMSAGDIAAQFEVSWSAVSQHLRVLKDAAESGAMILARTRPPDSAGNGLGLYARCCSQACSPSWRKARPAQGRVTEVDAQCVTCRANSRAKTSGGRSARLSAVLAASSSAPRNLARR
jgi:hypothetical protein